MCGIFQGTRGSMKNLLQEADESLNFDEMILEAAKSIAAATSALVKAASAAQRELIDQGKVQKSFTLTIKLVIYNNKNYEHRSYDRFYFQNSCRYILNKFLRID